MSEMGRERVVESGSVPLNVYRSQWDGPPLVCLHGLTTAWQTFQPLLPALTVGWQAHACDLRGHGRSGRRPPEYRLKDYVADLLEFLKTLKEPAVIIGHSLGGAAALLAAVAAPERVRAIVLGDTPLSRSAIYTGAYPILVGAIKDILRSVSTADDILRRLESLVIPTPGRPTRYVDLPGMNPALIRFVARNLSRLDVEALTVFLDESGFFDGVDEHAALSAVQCPMLLLQGDPKLGALLSDTDVDAAMSAVRNATRVRVSGVGHLLHMQVAEPIILPLTQFLSSLQ